MTDDKKAVDWAEIERDYRTGTTSVRELARWYGITEGAIRKKAKAGGWTREGAQAGTRTEGASSAPEPIVYHGTILTPENATPEAIVSRGRNLVLRMMDELEATTTRQGELDAMIVSATDTGDAAQQRDAMRQAVSLKGRSDIIKALTTAAKTLSEAGAPQGVKKQRQSAGREISQGGGVFAAPRAPGRTVQ